MFPLAVLALIFLDEILLGVAAGVWGGHAGGWPLAVLAPVVLVVCWWSFASPRAPKGGPVVRPVVKIVLFGLACLGLWVAGRHGWAVGLLVFSAVINAMAQLPVVRRQLAALETAAPGRGGVR